MKPDLTEIEIEQRAQRARCVLMVHDKLQPNLFVMLQRLSDLVKGARYEVLDDSNFLPDESGRTDCENKLISIPKSVMANLQRGEPRARMTVMHEIGHLVLGHKGVLSRNEVDRRAKNSAQIRQYEREAWRFAGAFLIPKRLAKKAMTPEQISETFGVSLKAAEIRLETLERMKRIETGKGRKIPDFVQQFLDGAKKTTRF